MQNSKQKSSTEFSTLTNFNQTRQTTVDLCHTLETEDYVVQVAEFASPTKWHLGHTTWFFETFVLAPNSPDYQVFHQDFGFLFNSYYNNAGDRVFRANRGHLTRPSVEEVYAYRDYVDYAMNKLLNSPMSKELESLIILGINHEQQHQELLLTDIKYTLSHNPLWPAFDDQTSINERDKNQSQGMIEIESGLYEIGNNGEGFCFDNEMAVHQVYLNDFSIDQALVTNGEYLKFVEQGGYSDFNLWLDEGWAWVQQNQLTAPYYWRKRDGQWLHYTLAGLRELEASDILAHISFYEAAAFAQWKGMRLPTEFEWEVAADRLQWGQRWEWTSSAYLPYPQFAKSEGAVGEYNGKFMINQMVLRGASIATSHQHSRKTYRNFFHPDSRWQFTGIRLAK